MTPAEYLTLLKSYSSLTPQLPQSATEKENLQQAVLWLSEASESENLGICADTLPQAQQTLQQYLQALGFSFETPLESSSPPTGAVYLKVNTQKQSTYLDAYAGSYRGVLLAVQSANEALSGTYGYFPLDLFD
jgi:hypothetical protein